MTQTTVEKTRSVVLLGAAVAGAVTISNSLTNTQNVSADEKTPAAQEATQQNQQTDAKTEAQTKVDNAETTYNQAKEQTDTTKNAFDATQAKVDEATKNQQTAQTNAALRYLELIGSLPTSSFFYTISIFERAKRTLHFLLVDCPDQRIENRSLCNVPYR